MATTRTKDKKAKDIQPVQRASACSRNTIFICSRKAGTSGCTTSSARTCTPPTVSPASISPYGPPMPARSLSSAISTAGDPMRILYRHARTIPGSGKVLFPGVIRGAQYKYHLTSHHRNYQVEKTDPFAIHTETPPRTASVVWDLDYQWGDKAWMQERGKANALERPHVHLTKRISGHGGASRARTIVHCATANMPRN